MTQVRLGGTREPLIWSTPQAIFAIDPETGALRWRAHIPGVHRLFRLGERLFLLNARGVSSLDIDSGEPLGTIELGFIPSTGLAHDDQLFFAGPAGAAALSPTGSVLWSVKHEQARGNADRHFFACQGRNGFQLWREEIRALDTRHPATGLLLGEHVEQPSPDEP